MKTALVLIDFENEWISPNSEYYVGDLNEVLERTNKLIAYARQNGYKIIFTRHIEKEAEDAFVEGSENVELISAIDKQDSDTLVTKYKISPFYNTILSDELEGFDSIIVAGILTNLCVRMMIEEAYDREFDITLVSDCSASIDEETHEFTLNDISHTRPEVNIVSLEELIK